MHWLLIYDGVENYAERRAPFREQHLALAKQAQARGELILAGGLADPVDGSVLLFKCETKEPVERFVSADPYVQNGAVARWQIRKWTIAVGGEPATAP